MRSPADKGPTACAAALVSLGSVSGKVAWAQAGRTAAGSAAMAATTAHDLERRVISLSSLCPGWAARAPNRPGSSPSLPGVRAPVQHPWRKSSANKRRRTRNERCTDASERLSLAVARVCGGGGVDTHARVGGEDDGEGRALAGCGVERDAAGVLLDDALGDGQAQPGAAEALGREERLEDLAVLLGGDAGAVVDDRDVNLGAGARGGGRRGRGDDRAARGVGARVVRDVDGDDAAAGLDGLDGVADEVHECLVDEAGVEREGGH